MSKLTAVTVTFNGRRHTVFVKANINEKGQAVISQKFLDSVVDSIGVRRGDTYSVG